MIQKKKTKIEHEKKNNANRKNNKFLHWQTSNDKYMTHVKKGNKKKKNWVFRSPPALEVVDAQQRVQNTLENHKKKHEKGEPHT